MPEGGSGVPLAEAIKALRSELFDAMEAGVGKQLKLRVDTVEVTLEAAVTDAGKVHGGIKWWVVEGGGEGSRQSVSTQKVTLKLTPVDAATNNGPVNLTDEE